MILRLDDEFVSHGPLMADAVAPADGSMFDKFL